MARRLNYSDSLRSMRRVLFIRHTLPPLLLLALLLTIAVVAVVFGESI